METLIYLRLEILKLPWLEHNMSLYPSKISIKLFNKLDQIQFYYN